MFKKVFTFQSPTLIWNMFEKVNPMICPHWLMLAKTSSSCNHWTIIFTLHYHKTHYGDSPTSHKGGKGFIGLNCVLPKPDTIDNRLTYNTMTGRSQVQEGRMQSLLLCLLLILLFAVEKFQLLWIFVIPCFLSFLCRPALFIIVSYFFYQPLLPPLLSSSFFCVSLSEKRKWQWAGT